MPLNIKLIESLGMNYPQQNRIQPPQQNASIIGVSIKKSDFKANPLAAKLNKTGPFSATSGKTKSPSATFNSTGPCSSNTNTASLSPIPSSSGCPKPASSSMDELEKGKQTKKYIF